eukprot:6201196-Prorocentrum_lima.AAC.1
MDTDLSAATAPTPHPCRRPVLVSHGTKRRAQPGSRACMLFVVRRLWLHRAPPRLGACMPGRRGAWATRKPWW